MEVNLKEKLIEIVRKHECLYQTRHKEYKNTSYKLLLWETIGAMLGIEGSKAKDMWRSLRDGYVRYKKNVMGTTGSGRKKHHYLWSSQLAFLDGTLSLRTTDTNISPPQEVLTEEPRSSLQDSRLFSTQPGPSSAVTPQAPWDIPTLEIDSFILSTTNTPSTNVTETSTVTSPVPQKKKRMNASVLEERTDKVLEYLRDKNNRKQQQDDVDHLFTSYAKTFKRFSRRSQAHLKVSLAKMFAEAELRELGDTTTDFNESPNSHVVILSPGYSVISDDSNQPILLTEDTNDTQVQFEAAEDLSRTSVQSPAVDQSEDEHNS